MVAALAFSIQSPQSLAAPLQQDQVTDVDYGVVLYYYYQRDYFTALSLLEVAKQRGGVEHSGINPQLLDAGMRLNFGITDHSARQFEELLGGVPGRENIRQPNSHQYSELSQQAQAQAWFYLSKIYYQQGKLRQLEQTLARVTEALPRRFHHEYLYLSGQLAITTGNWRQREVDQNSESELTLERLLSPTMTDILSEIDDDSVFSAYLHFNLAIALIESGYRQVAAALLQDLAARGQSGMSEKPTFYFDWFADTESASQFDDTERLGFHDRLYLLMGYNYLELGENLNAMNAFRQVRLAQLDTESALLGFGWAALNDKKYLTAVEAWKRLRQTKSMSPYDLEAAIALPFAYERLQAESLALEALTRAENDFVQHLQFLEEEKARINKTDYFAQFIPRGKWADSLSIFSQERIDVAPSRLGLNHIFASSEFQQRLSQLRDLSLLQAQLHYSRDELDDFQLMLNNRAFSRADKVARVEQVELGARLPQLIEQRDDFARQIAEAMKTNQAGFFATPQQVQWQARIAQAERRLQNLQQAGQATATQGDRLKRLAGILAWQLADQMAVTQWQTQRSLQDLDREISAAQSQFFSLQQVLNSATDLADLQKRLDEMQGRIEARLADAESLFADVESSLQSRLIAEVDEQYAQVTGYLKQVRLAIVRLNDEAYQREQIKSATYSSGLIKAADPAEVGVENE